jgi:hypothetical protein
MPVIPHHFGFDSPLVNFICLLVFAHHLLGFSQAGKSGNTFFVEG